MPILVTLKRQNNSLRREYQSYNRALSGIKRWLDNNEGLAVVYQPEKMPVVYQHAHDVPVFDSVKEQNFYQTHAWKALRYDVLQSSDGTCGLCGRSRDSGAVLHVDHIKPRSKYPELALELTNLQVLCDDCNIGKLDKDVK